MEKKICKTCKNTKNIDEFYQTKKQNKLKIKASCKECIKLQERQKYFEEHKEFILNKKPFNKQEYQKIYYEKNKEKILQQVVEYAAENKQKILDYKKNYYLKNKEKILKKIKSRRHKINAYVKNRRKNNLNTRIVHNLRTRIKSAIKVLKKASKTKELLGCSIDEFKQHLEKNFRDGMSWENYGKYWHVDHIKPCALFDMNDEKQQKECFHYTNLQPLLASENFAKSDKYEEQGK